MKIYGVQLVATEELTVSEGRILMTFDLGSPVPFTNATGTRIKYKNANGEWAYAIDCPDEEEV